MRAISATGRVLTGLRCRSGAGHSHVADSCSPSVRSQEFHQWWDHVNPPRQFQKGANAVKTNAFILVNIAVCALGVSSVAAGPCTTEIDNLAKVLASKDAGSGPTLGASGGTHSTAETSAHPPTGAMNEAAKGSATSAEHVRRQTAGQATQGSKE